MPSRILIVDDDDVTLSWLKAILERESYSVSTAGRGETALAQIAEHPPDLVVLDLILPDLDGLELLRRVRQDARFASLRVVILSVRDRPEDIVAGLHAGADDYVPKRPGADIELISKIRTLLATPAHGPPLPAAPAKTGSGKIISFCSAKGGTGTTSVCVNIAYALAQLEPKARVLLADMVFPVGTVAPSVGYDTAETISKLTRENKGKIDAGVVEKYISPAQRWGFRVLVGAANPQEATQLDVNQIGPLFETLQQTYDYVLVDFGRTLSRISLPVIQASNRILVILNPDSNTVKMTKLMLDYIESLGILRSNLILVNNRTVGRVWVSKEETESELKLPLAGTIPYELEYLTMALNAGVPFMVKFPDHAASMMFTDFARMIQDRGGR